MAHSGQGNHKSRDPVNEGNKKSGESSPSAVSWLKGSIFGRLIGSPPQENSVFYTELKVVADNEWLVIQKSEEDCDMSSSVATASSTPGPAEEGLNHAPKKRVSTAGNRAQLSTPPTGRTSSLSSKSKPPRPSSPHSTNPHSTNPHSTNTGPFQRKPSGRGSRSTNLEVQNGSAQRSVSPGRVRNSSPSRATGRTSSPVSSTSSLRSSKKKSTLHKDNEQNSSTRESKEKDLSSAGTGQINHVIGSHQPEARPPGNHSNGHHAATNNGKSHVAASTVDTNGHAPGKAPSAREEEEDVPTSSAFEKVRDTLRISRPKKKKKAKGKLAYSIVVDPSQMSTPEINLQDPSKYQDPFETSYAENGDTEKKMDHVFKPASIPHNKPEYCDHCGDMAWGLYRQVLKCSSKFGEFMCRNSFCTLLVGSL